MKQPGILAIESIVARLLVPTDQHTPKTVQPTMRALHHPSAGFETNFLLQCLGFFPPCTNVGREAKLLQEVSHLIIVIAFLQTQPLRRVWGRGGPLYGDLSIVSRAILKSWRWAPSPARPMGPPRPSVRPLRLVPLLPRSVGFLPTFFPPEGRFGHRAVHREPLPINALQGLVVHQTLFP